MKLFYLLIFLITALSTDYFSQQDSIVAEAGDVKITSEEFKQRFELIPQVNSKGNDIEVKKRDFLYSLITEKLWAKEAEKLNLDTSEVMETAYKEIEKMFVRDALYKMEITDNIRIADTEIRDGISKYLIELKLRVLYTPDSVKIYDYYTKIKNGHSFDSLYLLNETKVPPVDVKYGEMQKETEDLVYSLDEGETTPPVKSGSGWIIFKVIKKNEIPSPGIDVTVKKVKDILAEKKADSLLKSFYSDFFKKKKIEADGNLFWSVADKIVELIRIKKSEGEISENGNIFLENSDYSLISEQLGQDTLQLKLVDIPGMPVTVKDFLSALRFEGFITISAEEEKVVSRLNERVKVLIENELLAAEGYRRGLDKLPEVKESLKMWRENYLARVLQARIIDSSRVTDEEALQYYSELNNNYSGMTHVNIIEILTDSLEVIEIVLNELEKGTDFGELAEKYTKRTWTKSNGGEFGFFPVSMYGEIGRTAAKMNIGDVYGPIKTDDGFSIFKLIDKKETKDSLISFEQNKDKLKRELSYKKLQDNFINYTFELANKYGVTVNETLLSKIQVNDLKMYTIRNMGFGGRITAVPVTNPFFEWFEQWKESLKEIP